MGTLVSFADLPYRETARGVRRAAITGLVVSGCTATSSARAASAHSASTTAPAQRAVISLRDIEGWSSDEARNALGISETNQRVLLHRARSKVRQALEDYLTEAM